jgi:flagellar P-ring protein precursor FlgI
MARYQLFPTSRQASPLRWLVLAALLGLWSLSAFAARLKDLAALKGQRINQLTGYGVVVGLAGTGDKGGELTANSLGQVLKGFGLDQKPEKIDTRNAAGVLVSAVLPPFARSGTAIDITLSAIGTATSLEGGVLLMTALRGADGKVYAMAQGKVMIVKREGGQGAAKAVPVSLVTAEVPGGATLEREVAADWNSLKELRYQLFNPDFTTAARIARRINEELAGKYATAADAGTVDVILPYGFEGSTVDLIAQVESIDVEADTRARVVINPRTGTVVLGERVRVLPVAIAHGNLRLEVKDPAAPAAAGPTAPKGHSVMMLGGGANISDVVAGLNDLGASPDDLLSVLQSLKASGALLADLEVQ